MGASGEISDFQELQKYLDDLATDDYMADDGIVLTPREIHSYLCRVMYHRRNKCGPRALLTCRMFATWAPMTLAGNVCHLVQV